MARAQAVELEKRAMAASVGIQGLLQSCYVSLFFPTAVSAVAVYVCVLCLFSGVKSIHIYLCCRRF